MATFQLHLQTSTIHTYNTKLSPFYHQSLFLNSEKYSIPIAYTAEHCLPAQLVYNNRQFYSLIKSHYVFTVYKYTIILDICFEVLKISLAVKDHSKSIASSNSFHFVLFSAVGIQSLFVNTISSKKSSLFLLSVKPAHVMILLVHVSLF